MACGKNKRKAAPGPLEEGRANKITFTSNQLKIIAAAAMLLDHCAAVFVPYEAPAYMFLRMPGKITAPIMCFFIAEGYYHTSDLNKYMARLLVMAVISHVPFALCMDFNVVQFWRSTDVMFSLFWGLLALRLYHQNMHVLLKSVLIALCCLLAFPADWNFIAVLMVLFFGIVHEQRNKQAAVPAAAAGLYALQMGAAPLPVMLSGAGMLFSIPLLRRYNGLRGSKSKAVQWGFYWFYPVHLLIIYLIRQF